MVMKLDFRDNKIFLKFVPSVSAQELIDECKE